jgi:isoamyl acetate esterase
MWWSRRFGVELAPLYHVIRSGPALLLVLFWLFLTRHGGWRSWVVRTPSLLSVQLFASQRIRRAGGWSAFPRRTWPGLRVGMGGGGGDTVADWRRRLILRVCVWGARVCAAAWRCGLRGRCLCRVCASGVGWSLVGGQAAHARARARGCAVPRNGVTACTCCVAGVAGSERVIVPLACMQPHGVCMAWLVRCASSEPAARHPFPPVTAPHMSPPPPPPPPPSHSPSPYPSHHLPPAQAMASPGRRSIVLFGDSLTEQSFDVAHSGWGARLAHSYSRKADVVNRGFSGYTTRHGAALASRVFDTHGHRRLLTTVLFGANDASAAGHATPDGVVQHVPLDEYERLLTDIVRQACAVSDTVVVIAPPPVDSALWPSRSNELVAAYAAASKRVAAAAAAAAAGGSDVRGAAGGSDVSKDGMVLHLDAYAELIDGDWRSMLRDGLHFGAAGAEWLHRRLLEVVSAHCHPDSLGLDFPRWSTIENTEAGVAAALAEGGEAMAAAWATAVKYV